MNSKTDCKNKNKNMKDELDKYFKNCRDRRKNDIRRKELYPEVLILRGKL